MHAKLSLAALLATSSLTLVASAQYTPGTGGTPYLQPGTPYIPAPAQPGSPGQPQGPIIYSGGSQTPPPPPQAGQLQLDPQSNTIRIVQQASPAYPDQPQIVVPRLTDSQLADITACIALYPDPLLGEMLPASTYVEECTFADRWLAQHPGADQASIDNLPLHPSVKNLMHYPTVLTMLSDHVDWTQTLGVAFMSQGPDLMESIQRWRTTAISYGTLGSTPQFDVLQQGNVVYIVPPARSQVIYVPVYDPAIIFVRPRRPVAISSVISFAGVGFSLEWVHNDIDWHDHLVRVPVHHDILVHEAAPGRPPGAPGGIGIGRPNPMVITPEGRSGRSGAMPAGPAKAPIEEKTAFVHDAVRSGIVYPDKFVAPTPDHKVVILPGAAHPGDPSFGPGRGR